MPVKSFHGHFTEMPVKCPLNAREMQHFRFHGHVKSASKPRAKRRALQAMHYTYSL